MSYEQVLTAFLSKEAEIKRKGVEAARSASSIAAHLASINADAGVQLHLAQSGGQKRKAAPTCTHCDKRGHDAKTCWELHPELRESGMQMLAARRNKRQARESGSAAGHHLTYASSRPTSNPTVRVMNAHVLREVAKAVVNPMGTRPARTGATGVQGPPGNTDAEPREWYLDSGASHHVCGQRAAMTAYESTAAVPVLAAGGETLYALGVGSVSAWLSSSPTERDRRTAVVLSDVMFVPGLRSNLISVTALLKAGNQVMFTGAAAHIQDASGTTWATATLRTGETLFSFWMVPRPTAWLLLAADTTAEVELWHQRLNHLSLQPMLRLRREDLADGAADLPLASHVSQSSLPCDACAAGKSHRQPVPKKAAHRATRCLELVHSDMWGPIDVDAHGGWNGFLTFIDDFSREAVVYLMKGKSGADVLTHLTDYKAWAENITGQRLAALRTDNGGEFINRATDQFLRQHGVTRQVTNVYTSSQNGVAERYNRTIMDTVRSMLHHANLADSFWPLAVQAATYVKDRCPTTAVQHMTPHQAWHGQRPDLHSLRVFGCVAHLHIPEQSGDRINQHYTQSERATAEPVTARVCTSGGRAIRYDQVQPCHDTSDNGHCAVERRLPITSAGDTCHHQRTHICLGRRRCHVRNVGHAT